MKKALLLIVVLSLALGITYLVLHKSDSNNNKTPPIRRPLFRAPEWNNVHPRLSYKRQLPRNLGGSFGFQIDKASAVGFLRNLTGPVLGLWHMNTPCALSP